jgi:hypothetical protein
MQEMIINVGGVANLIFVLKRALKQKDTDVQRHVCGAIAEVIRGQPSAQDEVLSSGVSLETFFVMP